MPDTLSLAFLRYSLKVMTVALPVSTLLTNSAESKDIDGEIEISAEFEGDADAVSEAAEPDADAARTRWMRSSLVPDTLSCAFLR